MLLQKRKIFPLLFLIFVSSLFIFKNQTTISYIPGDLNIKVTLDKVFVYDDFNIFGGAFFLIDGGVGENYISNEIRNFKWFPTIHFFGHTGQTIEFNDVIYEGIMADTSRIYFKLNMAKKIYLFYLIHLWNQPIIWGAWYRELPIPYQYPHQTIIYDLVLGTVFYLTCEISYV